MYDPPGCERLNLNTLCREAQCPLLAPAAVGLDFFESLEGMLVKIPRPVLSGFSSFFGKLWVLGNEGKDADSVT